MFVHAAAKVKNGNREIPMQYDALIMPVRGLEEYAPKAWKEAERKAARKEAQEIREADERRAERKAKRAEAAKKEAEEPAEDSSEKPEEAAKVSPAEDAEPAQDSPEEGEAAIRRAAEEFGLAIRETSLCIWLAGDTKPHKDELKKAGAKWSAKKSAWYFRKPQAA